MNGSVNALSDPWNAAWVTMPAENPRSAKSGIGSRAEPSRRMRRRE